MDDGTQFRAYGGGVAGDFGCDPVASDPLESLRDKLDSIESSFVVATSEAPKGANQPQPRTAVQKPKTKTYTLMFTGIIEELGRVRSLERRGEGVRIVIEAQRVTEGSREGDSIAVNGVCLTALEVRRHSFAADGSRETLDRSTLGQLRPGSPVNLERAVTPSTRLGGHIVQGHVDARGKFLSATDHGGSWTVRIGYPSKIARYLVFKGSVSVEGISLTIADLAGDYFEIAVIPKTWEVTNFSHLRPGDDVNLEADVIAKYVERIMGFAGSAGKIESLSEQKLSDLGYK